MARPRVFISSTFYDLRQIRADLEQFVRDLGHEPVLNERGNVAYGSKERLEDYCYREVELCDILVSIIGGRYGSESHHQPYSISQMELKHAIDLGRQVYIFVNRSVLNEFETYQVNKDVSNITYVSVNDVRIFRFLEEVKILPLNNVLHPFDSCQDIISFLREQWAGLFQALLKEQARQREINILEDMKATVKTLNELVAFLTEDKKNSSEAVRQIILSNHPIFEQLRRTTGTSYRVYFTNYAEMTDWLRARRYVPRESSWDPVEEWVCDTVEPMK